MMNDECSVTGQRAVDGYPYKINCQLREIVDYFPSPADARGPEEVTVNVVAERARRTGSHQEDGKTNRQG